MTKNPSTDLKTGGSMPLVGFGTWDLFGETLEKSLQMALDVGYTHIDTAEGYQNEEKIGEVLTNFDREKIFLTSKVLPTNLHYDDVLESLNNSLKKLRTDYLNLYLIHWPNPAISLRETLHAFAKLHEAGKIKNIGVSNFNTYQLKVAQKITEIPISVNQLEFHPWYYDRELFNYCREHEIRLTASAPLARKKILEDSLIKDIGKKHNKTPAQVVLRWQVQQGVATIPKSSSKKHIEENFEIFDFKLTPQEMNKLGKISREERAYQIDLDDEIYGIP
ncbi:MAG: aldo/keto reductase, partial [Candidatus Bipolaricaulia bacterium]